MQYMHYKVELALDRLEEAILIAKENGHPYEREFYDALLEKMSGIREESRDALMKASIKNAAPAAATTETAKGDSDKESTYSLDENAEDVKRSELRLFVNEKNDIEAMCTLVGPNSHLVRLFAAAVETVVLASADVDLSPSDIERAYFCGRKKGIERVERKMQREFSELSADMQSSVLKMARDIGIPEETIQTLTGGEKE